MRVRAAFHPTDAKCTSHSVPQAHLFHAMLKSLSQTEAMQHGVKLRPLRLQAIHFQALHILPFRLMVNGFISHPTCPEVKEGSTYGVYVLPLPALGAWKT